MLDAATGKEIWKVKVEDHPVAKITGAPTLYEEIAYCTCRSLLRRERTAGWSTVYPCCTFRGSVVALDAANGHTIWKTYPVQDCAQKPTTKTSNGVQEYGPNGGAVWNTPTIDAKNHALCTSAQKRLLYQARFLQCGRHHVPWTRMKTGKIMWSVQDTQNDAWLSGSRR